MIKNHVRLCTALPAVDGKYEVHISNESYIVDLHSKECSCRVWEQTGIPCCHAIRCIFHARQDPVTYVDEFFYKANMIECYKYGLTPINDPVEWPYSNEPSILPPKYAKPPGRPKKNRRRAPDEIQSSNKLSRSGIRMTCTKCGGLGHNKRTCKAINPSKETTPTPQGNCGKAISSRTPRVASRNADDLIHRREKRLTKQGYGVRYFPETGNVLARTPGGRAIQYVSGARATAAAVSRLRQSESQIPNTSSSARIEDGSSQSSSAITTTIPNLKS
ncbi:hypothetical protein C2S52_001303 [Perilla frutescens var. hirtella]|nr:hypothetical protein C2S51_007174 [Perilla frutescens var. frutescens]KAH6800839.1 hypothetical protein C2S52_001303 [Perilla frutescens var. hirtella]